MVTQDRAREVAWWTSEATDADLWNGPGDGLEHLDRLAAGLDPVLSQPGAVGLELGYGRGRLLVPIARRYPDARFVGTDVTLRSPSGGLPGNVRLYATHGRTLPVEDESIDAAWSVLVFQHLNADAVSGYLAEFARVLRPDGRAVVQFVTAGGPDGFLHHSHTIEQMVERADSAGFAWRTEYDNLDEPPDWAWLYLLRP